MNKRECKFATVLRKLMQDKGISQNKLADKIRCGQNTIWKWLNMGVLPSAVLLMELADFFNVSIDYLVYGEGGRWSE